MRSRVQIPSLAQKKNLLVLNIFNLELKINNHDLDKQAIEWSVTRGSRSGRVAWQFIQDLAGKLKVKLK